MLPFILVLADPYHLADIARDMTFPEMHVTWHWEDCGEVNAYYTFDTGDITMCNELRDAFDPGVVRFAFAHEFSHAAIRQLHIPYTGLEETAADELAAVYLASTGHADDVMAAAVHFKESGDPEDPTDAHPSDMRRFYTLGCLAVESLGVFPNICDEDAWDRAVSSWNRLLPTK